MKHALLLSAAAATVLTLGACKPKPDASTPASEAIAPSETTHVRSTTPDPDMQAVLDKLASLGGKPIESLDEVEARKQPSPADAVKAIMADKGMKPDTTVTTRDVTYKAAAGTQAARIYTPPNVAANAPVILYIHGGGWVIADLNTYDGAPRALSKLTGAIVVSIEYRHAPEAKFPAAHDDANAAYQWVLANAASWGANPANVAVVGESAGGNMAVNVAIAARDNGWTAPKAIVAVYPVADSNMATGSKVAQAAAKPLNTPMLAWFFTKTLANPAQALDPRLNLVGANLNGLPSTTIILAEIDPLHDDGVNLADKLRAAGVPVEVRDYAGVTHEFFGMGLVVADSAGAQEYAADRLKLAFGK
ncbi:MAG: alpha/beta hydrolase [Caulobacter sp.]|nr:alpha/beta hydrolase [Caulobacter sp.]